MARRTIRARRSSPYLIALVVVFAVLFVAAAIGWGWTWNTRNEELATIFGQAFVDNCAQREKSPIMEVRSLYGDENTRDKTLVEMMRYYKDTADAYRSDIPRLTQQLTGDVPSAMQGEQLRGAASLAVNTANSALDSAAQTLTKSYADAPGAEKPADVRPPNMLAAVRSLDQRVDALVNQVRTDAATQANLETQLKGIQDEIAADKTEHARQMAQKTAEMKDLVARADTNRESAVATSQQLDKAMRELTDRYMADKSKWQKEKAAVDQTLSARESELKTVSHELQDLKKPPTEAQIAAHVISITELGKVGYADLGKKDGIIVGMTFSILGPNEMGKTTFEPKAQCRVMKIMDTACELSVEQLKADNPVIVGDVLFNPVYDRTRRLSFYLVGKMDIDKSGADNTPALVGMIEKYGGRVDTTLTHQTQYVVLGEEPVIPAPPVATAGPMERQQYEDAVKRFKNYAEAKAGADNFGVPMLSLNRFLGLMGMAGGER